MSRVQTVFSGDKFLLKNGGYAIVEKYVSGKEINVITNNGYKCKSTSHKLRIGQLQDPLQKTILNTACFGIGNNIAKDKHGNKNVHYTIWYNMIKRCYYGDRITYVDCYVCEEWLNFQNFAEWSKNNYLENSELDKDFKCYGNKIYSPDNCMYLPRKVNCLFRIPYKKSNLPFGVTISNGNYCSGQSSNKTRKSAINVISAVNHHWNIYYKIVLNVVKEHKNLEDLILKNFECFFLENYPELSDE